METTETFYKSDILAKLRANVCVMLYTKADGSERMAVGTLIASRVPVTHVPTGKGTKKAYNPLEDVDLITYYDLERLQWRAFHPSKLQWIAVTDYDNKNSQKDMIW